VEDAGGHHSVFGYIPVEKEEYIKSYVPYCSVKPPHTGLCPLRQCYPHINSYVPTAVLNLHIKIVE
jgi:hypothetical protein